MGDNSVGDKESVAFVVRAVDEMDVVLVEDRADADGRLLPWAVLRGMEPRRGGSWDLDLQIEKAMLDRLRVKAEDDSELADLVYDALMAGMFEGVARELVCEEILGLPVAGAIDERMLVVSWDLDTAETAITAVRRSRAAGQAIGLHRAGDIVGDTVRIAVSLPQELLASVISDDSVGTLPERVFALIAALAAAEADRRDSAAEDEGMPF